MPLYGTPVLLSFYYFQGAGAVSSFSSVMISSLRIMLKSVVAKSTVFCVGKEDAQ